MQSNEGIRFEEAVDLEVRDKRDGRLKQHVMTRNGTTVRNDVFPEAS